MMNLTGPNLFHQLSFSRSLGNAEQVFLSSELFHLSLLHAPLPNKPARTLIIRMGGGPRTYPGGVSKWQWKRMQAKKAKQLLKARLCRERQIYEMRKRAELKAAVSELERPWEVVESAPNLFSVKADEQLKVLADRFQKPGGFDLWTERDGPQLFETPDELPSARFFPKGVVHSVKPYKRISESGIMGVDTIEEGSDGKLSPSRLSNSGEHGNKDLNDISHSEGYPDEEYSSSSNSPKSNFEKGQNGKKSYGKSKMKWIGKESPSSNNGLNAAVDGHFAQRLTSPADSTKNDYSKHNREPTKKNSRRQPKKSKPEVYDMNLHHDGSYGFE